jgi:hypothetical protein
VLTKHRIWNAELPDVVHQPSAREQSELRCGHGHVAADVHAQPRHTQVVGPRLAIPDTQAKEHHCIEPTPDLLLYRRTYSQ